MDFTIKRSEWKRGEGSLGSYLVHPTTGQKCCVGFWALAQGCPVEKLVGMGTVRAVNYVANRKGGIDNALPNVNERLYLVNDIPLNKMDERDYINNHERAILSEAEREARITELFAQMGDKVTFED